MDLDNIIDISEHDGRNLDFVRARDEGHIRGVMCKATTGTTRMDPMYFKIQEKARAAGLLWGAYHVGTLGNDTDQIQNAKDQAKFFFETAFHNSRPEAADALLSLNYSPQGPHGSQTMTLAQVKTFVQEMMNTYHVKYVCIYSGDLIKEQLHNQPPDPALELCPLWILQPGNKPPTDLPPQWPQWQFWQYASGPPSRDELPAPPVPGIGKCGRDKFFDDRPFILELVWLGKA